MVSAWLAKGLVALVLSVGVQSQGTVASCAQTITARTGDTCASLAELAGISVTQFLRSNPYVTSCSELIGGAVYCKEGTATGPPTIPAGATSTRSSIPISTQPSGPLKVSSDGSCGAGITCAGSRFGLCCSAHGFCGTSADYCGEGCQVGLGECGADAFPSEPAVSQPPVAQPTTTTGAAGIATSTVTITATIFVTNTVAETTGFTTSTAVVTTTSLAYGNVTSTVLVSSTALATATQTVRATVVVTSTIFQTNTLNSTLTQTARVTATATSTLTQSTIETSVAISTTTATAQRTSLTIVTRTVHVTDTLTTVLTSTSVSTSVLSVTLTTVLTSTSVITATSIRLVTSTAIATATTTRLVTSTALATATSTRVVTVTSTNNVFQPTNFPTQAPTFIIGTPTVPGGGGGIFTTITQIQGPNSKPSPILPGAPNNCKAYDRILESDNCRSVATRNNLTLRDFYQLNPSVSTSILSSLLCTPDLLALLLSGLCQINCDNLWVGYYVCTAT